jgi:uncharacterized protein DUF6745
VTPRGAAKRLSRQRATIPTDDVQREAITMSTIDANTAAILERIAASNSDAPAIDRRAVELAFQRHFQTLGLATPPIRWMDGAAAFFVEQSDCGANTDWLVAVSIARKTGRRAAFATLRSTGDCIDAWNQRQWTAMRAAWRLGAPADAACDAAWRAAWRAVGGLDRAHRAHVCRAIDSVAQAAAWVNNLPLVNDAAAQQMTRIWLPMVDAWVAGLLLYAVTPQEIVCVPRPLLSLVDNRLHAEDGCAAAWPNGERYWFWRGVEVTRQTIEAPERLTLADIRDETNLESRRIMIERMGAERFLGAARGILVQTDVCGKLWHCRVDDNEPYAMVEVENGTPEPDGSRRHYFLRVPPAARTPREAIAWTYGLTADQYDVAVRT